MSILNNAISAQTRIALNLELPIHFVRACPTLEDAKRQATRMREFGMKPFDSERQRQTKIASCLNVSAAVIPLRRELAIEPFTAWWALYDEKG